MMADLNQKLIFTHTSKPLLQNSIGNGNCQYDFDASYGIGDNAYKCGSEPESEDEVVVELPTTDTSIPGWCRTNGFGTIIEPNPSSNSVNANDPEFYAILNMGESLVSPNGNYQLIVQTDGNMVVYDRTTNPYGVSLATGTQGGSNNNNVFAAMQYDGNFVLYRGSQGVDGTQVPIWDTNTQNGGGDAFLSMQDDGNLVVYDGDDCNALWSTW